MRRIEEAHKFELVLSIKALVARALADEVIEGRDVYWALSATPKMSAACSSSEAKRTIVAPRSIQHKM
jgi:hypothetical protein